MELWQIILSVIIIILLIWFLWWVFSDSKTKISSYQPGTKNTDVSSSSSWTENNFAISGWFNVTNFSPTASNILYSRENFQVTLGGSNGISSNDITITMPTIGNSLDVPITQDCVVSNYPLQTWVNLIISVYGRSLDVYIQGKLVRTCVLTNPSAFNLPISPDKKLTNFQVTPNDGFKGYTSDVHYYTKPVNPQQAYNIYRKGPSAGGLDIFNKYQLRVSYMQDGVDKWDFYI